MTESYYDDDWAHIRARSIAEGRCPDCGGAGEVYDMLKISRINDPHATKRCPKCRGTGKPLVALDEAGKEP